MKWKKVKISLRARINALKMGITWLAVTDIQSYNHDTGKWSWSRLSFIEKFDCFSSGLNTFIKGNYYQLEK